MFKSNLFPYAYCLSIFLLLVNGIDTSHHWVAQWLLKLPGVISCKSSITQLYWSAFKIYWKIFILKQMHHFSHFSHVPLFVSLWTIACQVPLSMVFSTRILEWVAMPSSRGSSWPRYRTHISCISCIAGGFAIHRAT